MIQIRQRGTISSPYHANSTPPRRLAPTTTMTKLGLSIAVEPTLRLPQGFSIAKTPLATFRRVDLLWSTSELEEMHREPHPEFYLVDSFGKLPVFTISPDEYLDTFT